MRHCLIKAKDADLHFQNLGIISICLALASLKRNERCKVQEAQLCKGRCH